MMREQYSVLSASNYEDALGLISKEDVSRIILGSNSAGADSTLFVEQLSKQTKGRNTVLCHVTATDSEMSNFPAATSGLTQFAISRTSDIQLLKEKFRSVSFGSGENIQQEKVEDLLNEVFGTLKDYTTEMCSSIRYASQIQKALLPGENSLRRIMDCFVFNSPKDIVSGDFFWYSVRFNRVILAVADCTGHGVPAALLSIIGNDTLNSIVNEKNITEPAEILKHVNLRVQRIFENCEDGSDSIKDGMDLAVISIDPATRTIDFAGARRPLTGFVNGEFVKIKGDLYSIGIHSPLSAEFTQHRISFGPDDVFYLGSDGYSDQFGGPSNKKIGSRQFEQFITGLHTLDTREQKDRAIEFFNNWKKHNEQTDDVLLMGIKPGSLLC
jgi:serine phosphatase RsbU (regulator of sigma subunit)